MQEVAYSSSRTQNQIINAELLLNPQARDPKLRALAYMQIQFSNGNQDIVDTLVPFVRIAIDHYYGQVYDPKVIAEYIEGKFGISVPYYVLDEMRQKLIRNGLIKREESTGAFFNQPNTSSISVELEEDDLSTAIGQLVKQLELYAESKNAPKPYGSNSWEEALFAFFRIEPKVKDTVKTATIAGVIVTNPSMIDQKIVGQFVMDCEGRDPTSYETVQKLYYGAMIVDFLTTLGTPGPRETFKNLTVVYDTTVLMRLLGTSGSILKVATLELHETLRDLGCRTYYFSHTFNELLNNISAIIAQKAERNSVYKETESALLRGEITIDKIMSLKVTAETELGKLNITEHPEQYDIRQKDPHQIDEVGFEKKLKETGKIGFLHGGAGINDSKSLAMIMRLREGVQTRDVGSSRAIFVTHNGLLASTAKRFLKEGGYLQDRFISPLITVGQMTIVGWLAFGNKYESNRVSKELIANCYRAAIPNIGWENAFWEKLKEIGITGSDFTEDKLKLYTMREIALGESFGHTQILNTLKPFELVEKAKQSMQGLRNQGKAEGRKEIETISKMLRETKASKIAASTIRPIKVIIAGIGVLGIFASIFPEHRSPLVIVGCVIAFIVSVISFLDLMGVVRLRAFDWVETKIRHSIQKTQDFIA